MRRGTHRIAQHIVIIDRLLVERTFGDQQIDRVARRIRGREQRAPVDLADHATVRLDARMWGG
jgi:hypothetical protein